MSTLLTPIITQLELDRNRLRDLVNGDELTTVILESRTEKSIAGQVVTRIDEVASDFIDAKTDVENINTSLLAVEQNIIDLNDQAEQHKNNAESAATASEGARDQSVAYHQDIASWRATIEDQATQVNTQAGEVNTKALNVNAKADQVDTWTTQVEDWKNETQSYRTETAQSVLDNANLLSEIEAAASGVTSLSQEPLGASPSMLYPLSDTVCDVTGEITLVASSARPILSQGIYSGRRFNVQRFSVSIGGWENVIDTVVSDYSLTISSSTLDIADEIRWKVEDQFIALDQNSAYLYETRNNDWRTMLLVEPSGGGTYPAYEVVDSPTINVTSNSDLSMSLTTSGYSAPVSDHQITSIVIMDSKTYLPISVYRKTQDFGGTVDLNSFDIDKDLITPDKEYIIRASFGGNEGSFSSWAETTVTSYSSYFNGMQDITEDVNVDHTIPSLYKVDITTNPVITLSSPPVDKATSVSLHINGGSGGTITFPVGVEVDVDSDPSTSLGANFTLYEFIWIGDKWIATIKAKG